ncbi:unnamed protein product [Anisakis simplex]|uniref:Condensin complex subunit 1 (inferred by orthology to a C. elegans protein) n=1 Tax=Anisakis simplex TaxID=6269 RepID=A0A0M3KB43_ANISI|nr:unnamed protein product [Anisakis simplex]
MARENMLNVELLDALSSVIFSTQGAVRVAALRLFSIICRANKNFMRERFEFFVELTRREAFFESDNGTLASEFMNAISMLGGLPNARDLTTLSERPFRIPDSHRIVRCIQTLLIEKEDLENLLVIEDQWLDEWNAEEENQRHGQDSDGMDTDDKPEELNEQSLQKAQRLVEDALNTDSENRFTVWETIAERVCAFIGQVALKTLIHVDISFLAEMKRKNELIHAMRRACTANDDQTLKGKPRDAEEWPDAREATKLEKESMERIGFFETTEQDSEDRLGLTGLSEDERISQRAHRMCEVSVFRRGRLLSRLTPFLLFILKSKKAIASESLKSVAALALSKVMLLSMHVCARMMPIFVHYLTHSPSAECRSNLMVAAGDLCFRFPNLIEKHSYYLYERIRDKDAYVRETCVIVLSHLILNDMVKVRGTVADLARCMLDSNAHVANLAKFFFAELSKKGNMIYNLMPDMISRLSSNQEVSVDDFGQIMKLLLSFIKKDKQADSLLEKLCQRMQTAIDQNGKKDERLAECLSYCISRLPLSEKSLRIMSDLLPSYAHLLSIDSVFTNLSSGITHFRKTAALRNSELKVRFGIFVVIVNQMYYFVGELHYHCGTAKRNSRVDRVRVFVIRY